jgi:hypothetical protein
MRVKGSPPGWSILTMSAISSRTLSLLPVVGVDSRRRSFTSLETEYGLVMAQPGSEHGDGR